MSALGIITNSTGKSVHVMSHQERLVKTLQGFRRRIVSQDYFSYLLQVAAAGDPVLQSLNLKEKLCIRYI